VTDPIAAHARADYRVALHVDSARDAAEGDERGLAEVLLLLVDDREQLAGDVVFCVVAAHLPIALPELAAHHDEIHGVSQALLEVDLEFDP